MIMSLGILCFLLSFFLFFSIRLNLKNTDKLERISERIEESLDVLDVCYQRATARAALEVLSDEPVVRELVEDIRISKDAILLVANLLTEPAKYEDE
jgi:hypothetical protein